MLRFENAGICSCIQKFVRNQICVVKICEFENTSQQIHFRRHHNSRFTQHLRMCFSDLSISTMRQARRPFWLLFICVSTHADNVSKLLAPYVFSNSWTSVDNWFEPFKDQNVQLLQDIPAIFFRLCAPPAVVVFYIYMCLCEASGLFSWIQQSVPAAQLSNCIVSRKCILVSTMKISLDHKHFPQLIKHLTLLSTM